MFDINPREVLIINPKNNKIYGFNGKDNILSSSEIEIDKTNNGVFNIILNAISAGEIGKISDIEGKPKTYNVQFVCIKGARVLWIDGTGFGKKE